MSIDNTQDQAINIDPFDPIHRVIREMILSMQQGFYHSTMLMAFTLPDQCAALEHPKGIASQKAYRKWVHKWVDLKLNGAESETGKEFYNIRCKLAHQNMLTHEKSTYTGIWITIQNASGNIYHNNRIIIPADENGPTERYLAIDLSILVHAIASAATRWYEDAKKTNPTVQANVEKLIYQHIGGPYTMGCDFFA